MEDAIIHINMQEGEQCTDLQWRYITVEAGIVPVTNVPGHAWHPSGNVYSQKATFLHYRH